MGVQDLFKLISSTKVPIRDMHLSAYRNKTVLIDTPIWLHKFGKTAENEWLKNIAILVCTLRSHGIKPLFLFDGHNKKPLKEKEQQKRKNESDRRVARLKLGKMVLDQLEEGDPKVTKMMIFELIYARVTTVKNKKGFVERTLLKEYGVKTLEEVEFFQFIDDVRNTVERLEKQTTVIGSAHTNLTARLLKAMRIPFMKTDGEAEAIAAKMINSGYADAVMTEDSDSFMHGCNTVLCFKNKKLGDGTVYEYTLDNILKTFDMDYEKFRDLCILLGNDYNERAKGYPPDGKNYKKPTPLGMTKAFSIMRECDSLEDAIDTGYIVDPEVLNIDECRATIAEDVTAELPDMNPGIPDYDEIDRILDELDSHIDRTYLVSCLR